jgi:hypothetical protein
MREVTNYQVHAFRQPLPQEGDILASRPTARDDSYAISVIPAGTSSVAGGYDDAIASIREFARQHAVDAWYTCNHIHFLRVAHHRSEEAS